MIPSPVSPTIDRDAARGMLLGLAVGDALGTTVEFKPRGTFTPVTTIVAQDRSSWSPGSGPTTRRWRFALATVWPSGMAGTRRTACAGSALAARGAQFLHRHLLRHSAPPRMPRWGGSARRRPLCGLDDPQSSGNGGIMRLAPAVIAYAHDPAAAERCAVLQSRVTHASPESLDHAARMARLLLSGDLAAAEGAPAPETRRRRSQSTGYVRHTWEAATWAVSRASGFAEAVLEAVNLGP